MKQLMSIPIASFRKILNGIGLFLMSGVLMTPLVQAGDITEIAQSSDFFPFLISYDGAENATDMKHLLDAPAGKDGFVRIENGRFVNNGGPIRLNATNLTGPANFPTHEQADKLARRLARFGFNCVRLHYFDASYGTFHFPKLPGIIDETGNTLRRFDKNQRDRQDYLIAALQKQGIYIDMNLHVARSWDQRDGFVGPKPWADKGLDNFEPRMIQLQKEYARELLTHVNPYTGLAYTDDPGIAVIEINNENALFQSYVNGSLSSMAQVYKDELRRQWNRWLKKKYRSTEELKQNWKIEKTELGAEQIPEGQFSKPVKFDKAPWIFMTGGTGASLAIENGLLNLRVEKTGENFFPKIYRSLKVKKNQVYTFSFRIRRVEGAGESEIGMAVSDTQGGWRNLGLHQTVKVNRTWKTVEFIFNALNDSDTATVQLTRFLPGRFEIDNLSFRTGAANSFSITGSLEKESIPLVTKTQYVPSNIRMDFCRFLFDTEVDYWCGMHRFLKNDLNVKQVVSGTQLGYSPPQVQARLDYVDNHSYWCHPSPVSEKWRIRNISMLDNMDCIKNLAAVRVQGKPYTVSEYNHPFPNLYGAEGQPMLRAYGRFQGWDGVFEYTYNHSPDFEPLCNGYFFSIIARTDVLAHFPACSAIFLRGDVREAKESVVVSIDFDQYMTRLAGNVISAGIGFDGLDSRMTLLHKTSVNLDNTSGTSDKTNVNKQNKILTETKDSQKDSVRALDLSKKKILVSDTGELLWNREIPNAPFWTVNTSNTKVFTGFPQGRKFELGNVSLSIGKTKLNWATVSLVSRHATGFGEKGPANILLAATGYCGNGKMTIEESGPNSIRLADWGKETVLAEGVPLVVTLPAEAQKTKCYALDPQGKRKATVPVRKTTDGVQIEFGPDFKTVWYEIDLQ